MNKNDIRIVISKAGLQEYIDDMKPSDNHVKPDIYFENKEQVYIGYNMVSWYDVADNSHQKEDYARNRLFFGFLDYLKEHDRSYNCVVMGDGIDECREMWNEGEKDNFYLEFPVITPVFDDREMVRLFREGEKNILPVLTDSQAKEAVKKAGFILTMNDSGDVRYVGHNGYEFDFSITASLSAKNFIHHILDGLSTFEAGNVFVSQKIIEADYIMSTDEIRLLCDDADEIEKGVNELKYSLQKLLAQGLDIHDYGKIINDMYIQATESENETWFLENEAFEQGIYTPTDLDELNKDIETINSQIDLDVKRIIDSSERYDCCADYVAVFYSSFLDLFAEKESKIQKTYDYFHSEQEK